MLTTIPFDSFMTLNNNGTVGEAKSKFDINFLKDVPLEYLHSYLTKECGLKVNGKGSSREVFFLNKSDMPKLKGPSCLKIPRTDYPWPERAKAGLGQNSEEIKILKKFQNSFECFPILYESDPNYYFMVVELGTSLAKAPNGFISKQFEPIRDVIEDFLDEFEYPSDKVRNYFARLFENFYDKDSFTSLMTAITTMMTDKQTASQYKKDEIIWFNEFIDIFENSKESMIFSIWETINFSMQKSAKSILWSDFIQPENWAFINRNGYFMLIPIDWGFTKNVAKKYY